MRRLWIRWADDFLATLVRVDQLILNQWQGKASPSSKILCLFAHFDPHGQIDPYVEYLLSSLHRLKADILFISSSENLQTQEVEKVLPYCFRVIQKKNLSLDFGSWRVGLQQIESSKEVSLRSYERLILANDSVYGPLFPLGDIFEKMRDFDFWSMSSSPELEYHLQSYFLVMSQRVFLDQAFNEFWKNFRFFRSKQRIIDAYEIGLSRLAKKHFWKMGAFLEHSQTEKQGLNPTLFSWEELIEKNHFPFLKTEVPRLNRGQSPRIGEWEQILNDKTTYDAKLIRDHLERLGISQKI